MGGTLLEHYPENIQNSAKWKGWKAFENFVGKWWDTTPKMVGKSGRKMGEIGGEVGDMIANMQRMRVSTLLPLLTQHGCHNGPQ